MKRTVLVAVLAVVALVAPTTAGAHDLDHDPPTIAPDHQAGTTFNSGGPNADWDLVTTVTSGNPHTDLDFFKQDGETYASLGVLGAGLNGGGQMIVRLTTNGRVREDTVEFISAHPSAMCLSNPANTLGLQHDVEATPKGNVLFNTKTPSADRRDTQLLLDATDAPGRCHDDGTDPTVKTWRDEVGQPQGGIEIVDVTNPNNPYEIGLTSHIGEAHTVNVDPKRPHIAYAVTSDAVTVSRNENGKLVRENQHREDSDRFDLDGFEVVDLSSCMNLGGMTKQEKRDACRPEVYRYRYPSVRTALGHTNKTAVYGCHELEVYPNDRLACGSGAAGILFDMSRAFNDMGTPNNYRDDKPRGQPLPCRRRPSSSATVTHTTAKVVDCVDGQWEGTDDLTVARWLRRGAPSLEGVRVIGKAHHQGRAGEPYDSTQDIDFNHEAELTQSRKFMIATDERGGGVTPPGATCDEADVNKRGNGGLHAYKVSRLDTQYPNSAPEAWDAYARTQEGRKAIYRAKIHTAAEATTCTAHVFQQIPGQNRIFMGWYTQGTQVVDFIERPDGTFEWKFAGYFIPENANTWVSHIFKMKRNRNGTFTYWGATGDFLIEKGRNAMDVYKVTLPAPVQLPSEVCKSGRAERGTRRDDVLVGTPRPDILCGLGGDDLIRGLGGGDIVVGGAGRDIMRGGPGFDDAFGGNGADTVSGQGGKDRLRGNNGRDVIDGNASNDVIVGGAGSDSLRGNSGFDTVRGSGRGDNLQGGRGDDGLFGEGGGDTLRGFTGNDLLHGGPAFDTCKGGAGNDRRRGCEA